MRSIAAKMNNSATLLDSPCISTSTVQPLEMFLPFLWSLTTLPNMDFNKLMSAQIAQHAPTSTKASKYLKRRELEASREAAYLIEQSEAQKAHETAERQKRSLENAELARKQERDAKRQRLAAASQERTREEKQAEDRARRKRLGLPEEPVAAESAVIQNNAQELVSDVELTIQLRQANEPARLFGETHRDRLERLNNIATMDAPAPLIVVPPIGLVPTSLEPLDELEDMQIPNDIAPAENVAARRLLARQISSWFNLLLHEWKETLAKRDEEVRSSAAGKQAIILLQHTADSLRPLFKRLEDCILTPKELPDSLLLPLCKIFRKAQLRRYLEANDVYLRLSIGKAAWPIGVTMVGIHERSAREKLNEGENLKAHIMADESTRRFLQSIKRCLTFAQTRWPPDDLAQMMG